MFKYQEFMDAQKGQRFTPEDLAMISGKPLPPIDSVKRNHFMLKYKETLENTLKKRGLNWVVAQVNLDLRILTDVEANEYLEKQTGIALDKLIDAQGKRSGIDDKGFTPRQQASHEANSRFLAKINQGIIEQAMLSGIKIPRRKVLDAGDSTEKNHEKQR